ncbi:MAG: hypothetical protein AMJ53_00080 [Gammaproteobacteria bacterium SG8_11]|nr:MAG: hypothetical protein AMJ53_00080 [Gammaproteobacteria bacterium SG8_11]
MAKITSTSLRFFFLFIILLSGQGFAQYLIKIPMDEFKNLESSNIWRVHWNENWMFVEVSSLQPLTERSLDFQILDDDTETDKFYQIESSSINQIQFLELPDSLESLILWRDKKSALLRNPPYDILETISARYFTERILCYPYRPHGNESLPSRNLHLKKFRSGIIQSIIDSVKLDELYYTQQHLTGEEPFWNGTQYDSIMTRYSYSIEIYKAENYIQMRLEEMGYIVEKHPFSTSSLNDVQFVTGETNSGWIVGEEIIYGTSDGGQTWSIQYRDNLGVNFRSIFPVNNKIAYTVGENGTILKTSDGGSIWHSQVSPVYIHLFGVYFHDEYIGWICGDSGTILKTTNGGQTWIGSNTPTTSRLYDVYFTSKNAGWAVGRDGTIIHTGDGGETWIKQISGTNERLYGVHFLSPTTGFAIGWNGTILETNDGGNTWTSHLIQGNEHFIDIDFLDKNNGLIASLNGTFAATNDGGDNWILNSSNIHEDIYAIDILNENHVWISGSSLVAQSNNFVKSWHMKLANLPEATLNNLIATLPGTSFPDDIYILCAHYDATSNMPMLRAPGADDNGSGTAAVIEAARLLAEYNFKSTIKFALFAAEEQGLIGSRAYANHVAVLGDQIFGVINMDMIGYDGNNDGHMDIHSGTMLSSQLIGDFIVDNISDWGLALVSDHRTIGASGASDHRAFWEVGYPAIMLIEDFSDFNPFYHKTTDLLSAINSPYYREMTRLAVGSIALLAEIDSTTTSAVEVTNIPKKFFLYSPYPNPFNPSVNIQFDLPAAAEAVHLEIFDILGRRVRHLLNERMEAGQHKTIWNSITETGSQAPSGVYILRLKTKKNIQTKKIVLMK